MKIKVFLLILFITISVNLLASPYDMILVGDTVIEDIRFLSLETGLSLLSFTPPFAPHEIKIFLDRVDPDTLSAPAREAYNRISKRLSPAAPLSLTWDNFAVFLNVNVTLEGKARFNDNVDWYPDYSRVPSFISVPVRAFFVDSVQLYFDPEISIDLYDYYTNDNFSNNIVFLGGNEIHGNSPFRAFLAAGGSWWNFQIGRDRLSTGTGISGNLSISDNPPFYEFMRLSFFSKYFKYSLLVNQTPIRVTKELFHDVDKEKDPLIMTTQRYFYLHRFDVNIKDVLSLSVSEGVMAGNSALELRFLNPLMIFHNMMTWRDYDNWKGSDDAKGHLNGSFFTAEINWHITKSFSAYTQFSMTELSIGPELGEDRDENPNAIGFMFGMQYSHSFNKWASVFYLECIYTSPFLYMTPSPFASIIYMHILEFVHSKMYYYYFAYPRDTFAISAGARFFDGNKLILSGEFSWISRGEYGKHPIEWNPTKDFTWAPAGTPENNFILSAGAQWKVLSFLTLNASLTGIYTSNHKNISGSDEVSGQASFSVSFSY